MTFCVAAFTFLKSVTKRHLPGSFFFTNKIGAEYGLVECERSPSANISSTCLLMTSCISGAWRKGGVAIGVLSISLA